MSRRDHFLNALHEAARLSSPAMPGLADVAAAAQTDEATVREHLGAPENFAALLAYQAPAHETRERIIASAAHVFGQKGLQRASMDEVAAHAGMTKGAIYWHFKNKNDLFFALLDQRFQQESVPLRGSLASFIQGGGDLRDGMTELFAAGMRRCTDDPDWARLYLECLSQSRNEEVRVRLSAFYDKVWTMSAQMTRDLQEHGLAAPDTDPQLAAVFWCALFDGLLLAWLIKGGELDMEATIKGIFTMLWPSLAPPLPNLVSQGEPST